MSHWQEPRPGTKGARIVRLLRRPEGATLRELADGVRWKTASVRGHLSTIKAEGLDVQSRYREDGPRVWFVPKVDKRRKAPEPTGGIEPLLLVDPIERGSSVSHDNDRLLQIAQQIIDAHDKGYAVRPVSPYERAFLLAMAQLVLTNPLVADGLRTEILFRNGSATA